VILSGIGATRSSPLVPRDVRRTRDSIGEGTCVSKRVPLAENEIRTRQNTSSRKTIPRWEQLEEASEEVPECSQYHEEQECSRYYEERECSRCHEERHRYLTESESRCVAGAASSGGRKEELVEWNAAVALKAPETSGTRVVRRGKTRGVIKWHRRNSVVFGSGALFPYGERVSRAASSGRRKIELVERNASVALKTAVTEIRVHEQLLRVGKHAV